jgi:hypothetical protein
LFDYALEMIQEASFDELMDHSSKDYLILFERSLIVINYLNSLKLNLNDQQMLKKCKKENLLNFRFCQYKKSFRSFKEQFTLRIKTSLGGKW